jgi:FlaA1/EpsC-like NDP-sugar epimerase
MGSRGSVIPFFIQEKNNGILPITDNRMTRFMITLEEGVKLVWTAFDDMHGGEIYVKKIPSMKVIDLATAIDKDAIQEIIGIRPGEKLHEEMIGEDDAIYTYEYDDYYKILPAINNWSSSKKLIKNGKRVVKDFSYTSDNNREWMSMETLREWVKNNKNKIGKF